MWFTETPWPPILILSVVAVALLLGWNSTKRRIHLAGLLLAVLSSGAVYLVEQRVVTDREEVATEFEALISTFQTESLVYDSASVSRDGRVVPLEPAPKSLEFISSNAADLRQLVQFALGLVEITEPVRLTDVSIAMKAKNSRAVVHFRANANVAVSGYGDVGHRPTRWELTWQREGEAWKAIKVRRLNVLTGEEFENPLVLEE